MSFELRKRIGSEIVSQIEYIGSPLKECVLHATVPHGKLLRSQLLINTALLYGYDGDLDNLIAIGAAIEHGHLASLIHDDIIDGDVTRRGKAALHVKYGTDVAIVAGDSLLFTMFSCIARHLPENVGLEFVRDLADMGLLLCQGEIQQCHPDGFSDSLLGNYIEVCNRKTASYFVLMGSMGARIAGASDEEVEQIKKFARVYGLYYQIRDDLLSLISTDSAEGKPLDSDQRNNLITAQYFVANNIDLRAEVLSYVYSEATIPNLLAKNTFEFDDKIISADLKAKELVKIFEQDLQELITALKTVNTQNDSAIRQLISEIFR